MEFFEDSWDDQKTPLKTLIVPKILSENSSEAESDEREAAKKSETNEPELTSDFDIVLAPNTQEEIQKRKLSIRASRKKLETLKKEFDTKIAAAQSDYDKKAKPLEDTVTKARQRLKELYDTLETEALMQFAFYMVKTING